MMALGRTCDGGNNLSMHRARYPRFVLFSVLVALSVGAIAQEEAPRVTTADVENALKKGAACSLRMNRIYRPSVGYSCLSVMAILNAGVSPKDATVADTLDYITHSAEFINEGYGGPYE